MIYKLFQAVEAGNLEKIISLLEDKSLNLDVNSRAMTFEGFDKDTDYQHYLDFFYKRTPLFIAIFGEDLQTTSLLLDKGASTEKIDDEDQSALEVIFLYSFYNNNFDKLLHVVLSKSPNLSTLPVDQIIQNYNKRGFYAEKYKKLESFGILGCCEGIIRADFAVVSRLLGQFKVTAEKLASYLQQLPRDLSKNQIKACEQFFDDLAVQLFITEKEVCEFKTVINFKSQKTIEVLMDEEVKIELEENESLPACNFY